MRPISSDQVKALLPEGQAVALREKGITELPLARLNARLAPHGYVIHVTNGSHLRPSVACVNEEGQVEQYQWFELGRISSPARGCRNSDLSKRS